MSNLAAIVTIGIYIIVNSNGQNLGDKNQSIGISQAIERHLKLMERSIEININEISIEQKDQLERELAINKNIKNFIITAGKYGIEFASTLTKPNKDKIIWTGHGPYIALKKLVGRADIIILPLYTVNEKLRTNLNANGTILLTPPGVATNISKEFLQTEYMKSVKSKEIDKNSKMIIAFIGGDAPDLDENLRKMTKKEAYRFGQNTAKLAQENDAFIIALNCSRTSNSQYVEFEKGMKEFGIKQNQYKIYDFHKGDRIYYSLLYKLSMKGNLGIITGDSSSMVRDMIEMASAPIYIQQVSSMGKTHHLQAEYECNNGHAYFINDKNNISSLGKEFSPAESVTEIIAKEILNYVEIYPLTN